MNISKRFFIFALMVTLTLPLAAQVTVRNIIPNAQSGETNQDSEPNLAVNPANPDQIVATAFTPDPGGSSTLAPYFVSTDRGVTWVMNNVVPSSSTASGTGDITVRFGGTSGILYAGILKLPGYFLLNVLRKPVFNDATVMDMLVSRSQIDQPYVAAATVSGGAGSGLDRVYIGHNELTAGTQTATIEASTDAGTTPAPAGFTARVIEPRATNGQDLPPIRPAIHPDGTIYAGYYGWRSQGTSLGSTLVLNSDVVVVRDDTWATGGTPFTSLSGSDMLAGFIVAANVRVPFNGASQPSFGQERFVSSNLSIAVDPRNSDTVWVAWADYPTSTSTTYTLHVRRSTSRGTMWSGDLLTVPNATNPALAINSHGRVGFAYQELTSSGSRWQTHFRRTDDGIFWSDLTLSDTPSGTPAVTFTPYIGDYIHVAAVGKDFYGIFSANNTPNMTNFPNGATFQRNFNSSTMTLRNFANTADVAVSIDPFFFRVTELEPPNDFYVPDWNASTSSRDTGVEPSTNPVFYATSDVWNRRSTSPGTFPGGAPDNEPAGNGAGLIGKNWAFARIRRNATSTSPVTVTAHFLVSRFGTGSSYIDANDDPAAFPNPDPTVTFAAGDLEAITAAWEWNLPATMSSHLCLAVEISAPGDPFVAPTLRGNTPGWPTTDLRILNDNNKAQRNMGLSTTPASGSVGGMATFYALVHNAATYTRDMNIAWQMSPEVHRRMRKLTLEIVGSSRRRPLEPRGAIVLEAMRPGEDRWLAVRFAAPEGREGEILAVDFFEKEQGISINGFSIGAKLASDGEVLASTLDLHRSVFTRLEAFEVPGAKEIGAIADPSGGYLSPSRYLNIAERFMRFYEQTSRSFPGSDGKTSLGAANAAALRDAIDNRRPSAAALAHASLLNDLDTQLTMAELAGGNAADIVQTVRWQNVLVTRDPRLASCGTLRATAADFIGRYQRREADAVDYARLLAESLPCLQRAAGWNVNAVSLDDAQAPNLRFLQKQHRDALLAIEASMPK